MGVWPENAASALDVNKFSFNINDLRKSRKVTPQILVSFPKYSMCDFSFLGGSKKSFIDGHLRYFNIVGHPTGPAKSGKFSRKGALVGTQPALDRRLQI
jgi:hypothetical protein